MKTEFTKQYILENRGCYSTNEVNDIPCIDNDKITLNDLFNDIPIRDFTWFFVRKCNLTNDQKNHFALHCAKLVLPVYENKYPNDYRVRECIFATEQYLKGEITRVQLNVIKNNAADAYAAVYDSAAANAAAAAVYAAPAAGFCSYAVNSAANAAAAPSAADEFKNSVWKFIETNK